MSKKSDDRKNVVIVGGGFAGFNLVKLLTAQLDASKYNLTLITAYPYHVHLVAAARMTVTAEGKYEDVALMPYDNLFKNGNGTHKVGTVTAIKEIAPGKGGSVILKSGEQVSYDVLTLATGSTWSGPLNFPESDADIRAFIEETRRKYALAKEIVLVGGGAVGIETAGEIKDVYPTKKVTIVHGDSLLLNNTYPEKFRKNMERRIRAHGVDLILGDYVDTIPEPGTVGITTRNGKSLPNADLVIATLGGRPNTEFVSSFDSSVLTKSGNIRVKPTLEVVGHPGIFAAGDVIDWKEQKQAGKAPAHAAVVAANIQSYLADQPQKKEYKGSTEMIIIPIGKNDGAGYFDILWGITIGGWITGLLKGKDLFVKMTRSQLGLQ